LWNVAADVPFAEIIVHPDGSEIAGGVMRLLLVAAGIIALAAFGCTAETAGAGITEF
jgi:hypothetical protein